MRELRAMDFVLLLLVMLLRQEVAGLKLQHIRVPTYLLSGENAFLECGYDLETEKLYAISWYKDQEEFYKFIARGETNKHSYPVAGVKVDYRHSDDHQVILQNVSLHTSGQYRCEISAEAPSFEAVSGEASMEIIELSQEKPVIVGEEKVYASGDVLALNCTSGKSHPAAQLKWFVNGQQFRVTPVSRRPRCVCWRLQYCSGFYCPCKTLPGRRWVSPGLKGKQGGSGSQWKRTARSDERFVMKDNHTLIGSES
ncbi:uncharacterized protein LOC105285218 isoform X2 [Ooceraea biroi]|uniref:uncharacterized protein LOC105285218 isoform X2 n=1 Tax=Ooceraea biroi TaxID=2015173 RepID=UPI0005B7E021|nr:uncharacterized protein LOC105285218 isoform X2 [Ooceraea biroi]